MLQEQVIEEIKVIPYEINVEDSLVFVICVLRCMIF
jgi:hypothetical protein